MSDPMDCEHDFEVIQDWHDPTGEAPISSNFTRLVKCKKCEVLIEETMPREKALKKFPKAITYRQDES